MSSRIRIQPKQPIGLKLAQSARDDAQRNHDRMKDAFSKSVATQTELDGAKYHLESAESEVVAAGCGRI